MRNLCFPLVVVALMTTACPSSTLLTIKQQESIEKKYKTKVLYLKYSCYATPFWAYDDRLYLTEHEVDERVLISSPGGDPILPGKSVGIVPMGTRVRIRKIEFPTSQAMSERKLHSPRHFIWVFLDVVAPDDKNDESRSSKPYVLVLTQQINSMSMFEKSLKLYLVDSDPRVEFSQRSPEVIEAINNKKVVEGMRYDSLLRSRGEPEKVMREVKDGVKWERWIYAPGREVVLKDDRVVRWSGLE